MQAVRALINPRLFKYDHFRQAALAIGIGIIIQLIVQIPVCFIMIRSGGELLICTFQIVAVRLLIWTSSWVVNLEDVTWDDNLLSGLDFLNKSVLQVPFLLMTLLRYITPTLDEM